VAEEAVVAATIDQPWSSPSMWSGSSQTKVEASSRRRNRIRIWIWFQIQIRVSDCCKASATTKRFLFNFSNSFFSRFSYVRLISRWGDREKGSANLEETFLFIVKNKMLNKQRKRSFNLQVNT